MFCVSRIGVAMPNSLTDISFLVKVFAVVVAAVFAMSLTEEIDKEGRLHLSLIVLIKFTFSAVFGFFAGSWLIEFYGWLHLSPISQGFIMMLASLFGMTVVGIIYQAVLLSTTNKTLPQIITEIKETFKAIFK